MKPPTAVTIGGPNACPVCNKREPIVEYCNRGRQICLWNDVPHFHCECRGCGYCWVVEFDDFS